jgi:uncharacterized protein YqeY
VNAPIRQRMRADLTVAIKSRDAARVTVLRTTLAAIDNAESVDPAYDEVVATGLFADVARRRVDEAEIRDIVRQEYDELMETVDTLRRLGPDGPADDLAEQASILASYLGCDEPLTC